MAQALEKLLEEFEEHLQAQLTRGCDPVGVLQLYAAMDWQYLFERTWHRGCEETHLDSRLRSPLHYACAAGSLNIVRTLVQSNDETRHHIVGPAELNGPDISGRTPLHLAVRSGDPQLVKMIAGLPAIDLSMRDRLGQTALHQAAHSGISSVLKVLLHNTQAEADARALDGTTPLHLAVFRGHYECLNMLLAHPDTNVNAVDGEGCTALHRATSSADKIVVDMLLCHKDIDIFMPNEVGRTAPQLAAQRHERSILRSLLKHKSVNLCIDDEAFDEWGPMDLLAALDLSNEMPLLDLYGEDNLYGAADASEGAHESCGTAAHPRLTLQPSHQPGSLHAYPSLLSVPNTRHRPNGSSRFDW